MIHNQDAYCFSKKIQHHDPFEHDSVITISKSWFQIEFCSILAMHLSDCLDLHILKKCVCRGGFSLTIQVLMNHKLGDAKHDYRILFKMLFSTMIMRARYMYSVWKGHNSSHWLEICKIFSVSESARWLRLEGNHVFILDQIPVTDPFLSAIGKYCQYWVRFTDMPFHFQCSAWLGNGPALVRSFGNICTVNSLSKRWSTIIDLLVYIASNVVLNSTTLLLFFFHCHSYNQGKYHRCEHEIAYLYL